MSLASCQPGVTRCTSFPSSSKQKRKKRCGYQCRQKCQNLCVVVGQTFLSVPPCASIQHRATITDAPNVCPPINFTGCARFSANTAISALDIAKYPSATHSNAPHAAQAAAASRMNNVVIPFAPCSKLTALSSPLPGPASARQASAASFPRYCCRCTAFIQGSPVLLLASGDRRLLLFLLCDAFIHSRRPSCHLHQTAVIQAVAVGVASPQLESQLSSQPLCRTRFRFSEHGLT